MQMTPTEIVLLLNEEDLIHLSRHFRKSIADVKTCIHIGLGEELYRMAKYIALQNLLGVHNREVQLMMQEVINHNYQRP